MELSCDIFKNRCLWNRWNKENYTITRQL